MKFIVGLGNPGASYKSTKHNIGFAAVQRLAKLYRIKINQKRYSALVGEGAIDGERILLVLPQTYMNLSGKALGKLSKEPFFAGEDMIVVCDDINLKLGRIRVRKNGSSGGHKGLRSIIDVLGSDDFARLRVGIETDVHRGDITNYVLTPFKRKERKNVSGVIDLAADALVCWARMGIEAAMTKFNTRKSGTS